MMTTKQKTTDDAAGTDIVHFQPPRLPYHQAIQDRFGIDRSGWNALVNAVYPSANSVDSICMALSYCKARHLDPFKRPVHIVPMWDARLGHTVETVWPGISEIRTTAARTGGYAGCDEALFGADETKTFHGARRVKNAWEEDEVELTFPRWCQITVYRLIGGVRCPFVGPKVWWLETYATTGKGELPNDMWMRRSRGQLEKCAEAAALRKAFPEELGNMLTAEEMEGQKLTNGEHVVEAVSHQPQTSNSDVKVVQSSEESRPLPPVVGEADAEHDDDEGNTGQAEAEKLPPHVAADPAKFIEQKLHEAADGGTLDDMMKVWKAQQPAIRRLSKTAQEYLTALKDELKEHLMETKEPSDVETGETGDRPGSPLAGG